jgi:hypothetical protein
VRKFENIFYRLNENNPTLNIKSTLPKGRNLDCIVVIRESLLRQNVQE